MASLKRTGSGGIDAFDLGAFHEDVGLDFHGAKRSGCVGREEGIADAGRKNHDATFLKVADGAAANVRLCDLIHGDGGHHAALDIVFFDGVLECDGVDDGREHAHVVGGDAIHLFGLLGDAAEEVSTANDDGDFYAEGPKFHDFGGDLSDTSGRRDRNPFALPGLLLRA